jgi:hypothetical protein
VAVFYSFHQMQLFGIPAAFRSKRRRVALNGPSCLRPHRCVPDVFPEQNYVTLTRGFIARSDHGNSVLLEFALGDKAVTKVTAATGYERAQSNERHVSRTSRSEILRCWINEVSAAPLKLSLAALRKLWGQ